MQKYEYLGWQIGLTYCHPSSRGADYQYMMRLLDEMVEHGMNLISIMMQSYSIYDPIHDGYSWPVRNGKLQAYRDENAMNSDPNTEFLSNIIKEASKRNIEVELFLNYGI